MLDSIIELSRTVMISLAYLFFNAQRKKCAPWWRALTCLFSFVDPASSVEEGDGFILNKHPDRVQAKCCADRYSHEIKDSQDKRQDA